MDTVLLVIHLMVAVALIGVIMLQRSEGGALGIGGSGGLMTGRGTANFLTRVTAMLAAGFFATSIALTLLSRYENRSHSILPVSPASSTTAPTPASSGPNGRALQPLVPTSPAPSAPAAPAAPAGSAAPASPATPAGSPPATKTN
jgi:preprotein translocase subunit SecG